MLSKTTPNAGGKKSNREFQTVVLVGLKTLHYLHILTSLCTSCRYQYELLPEYRHVDAAESLLLRRVALIA